MADPADVKSILAERKRRTNLASATRYREEHREEIRARNLPHAIKRTMDYVASKESLDVPMYCDAASIAVRGIKIRDVYVDATVDTPTTYVVGFLGKAVGAAKTIHFCCPFPRSGVCHHPVLRQSI